MAFETIIVETEDHVCLIRLNRPDALNALNTQLLGELCEALEEADGNDKVRCIVITGSEKAFAAGADIKEMSGKSFVDVFTENLFADANDRITTHPQADHRGGGGLCPGRRLRAGDGLRFHHRRRHRQVRPARDQPGRHRRASAAPSA